jgi:hypothetical protein
MMYAANRVLRFVVLGASVLGAAAFTPSRTAAPAPGMSFKLRVTFRHTPANGRATRTVTLMGHGVATSGMGRIDVDTLDVPSQTLRKGDFFIIRDSTNTFWARPTTMTVRRWNSPLINPLEGINESITSGMGSPRSLRVDFDTVSLDEEVNGHHTRHFRITADVVYPIGNRNATQKIIIDHWLARLPTQLISPFSSRMRGLPDVPSVNAAYREFIRTLAAANRVYGDAVTVRTTTTTSTIYAPGLGEDYFQTVDLTDLQPVDVDERQFQLSAEYKLLSVRRDTVNPPIRKPPRQ